MEDGSRRGNVFGRLWWVFFFHGMAPGFWLPALTNLLRAEGLSGWVAWAFAVPPICALVSPVIGGAVADQRMPAERFFAWISLVSAVFLVLAFGSLQAGWGPWWFIIGLALYSLVSGPSWGLLATISLTHLANGEKQYPLVRMGGTVGWMGAGFLTSFVLQADASPVSGYASAVARVASGLLAFLLPHTRPLGVAKSWLSALGLDAFSLFRNRDHAVLFGVTCLYSVPLTAFYMYAPEMLRNLGNEKPTATMTAAQWSEIGAMFFLGAMMFKFRIKTLLMCALGLSSVRFAMSAYSGFSGEVGWHVGGIALHGVCFTLYFISAQVYLDRRVDPGLRGQAQGLMGLMSAGIGPLVGAFFCGWLREVCVDEEGGGWEMFWGVLSAIVALCLLVFGRMYRGLGIREEEAPSL